jgi:hypothetical protein
MARAEDLFDRIEHAGADVAINNANGAKRQGREGGGGLGQEQVRDIACPMHGRLARSMFQSNYCRLKPANGKSIQTLKIESRRFVAAQQLPAARSIVDLG